MSDTADVVEITKVPEKKIEANRRNARQSTGPRTEAGKNRSRYNAVKHGIFSIDALQRSGLGKEDAKKYDELLTMLRKDREPVGVLEEVLVDRIAVCLWRLKRALQYETGTMEQRYQREEIRLHSESESDSNFEFLTRCYRHLRLPEDHDMDLLLRYETTIQRQLAFALNQLERLQRARTGEHVPAPVTVQITNDQ